MESIVSTYISVLSYYIFVVILTPTKHSLSKSAEVFITETCRRTDKHDLASIVY
jgi:hypothetical protein